MNTTDCFALLDDASAADPALARSRLYTRHAGTLACVDAAGWPQLLADMQEALARGLHAVSLLTYELGGHLLGIDAHPAPGALGQVLLFEQCDHLSAPQVAAWLAARAVDGEGPAGIAAVRANIGEAEFTDALGRIHELIAAGDTYQVNYTYRLRFDAFGSLHRAVRPPARAPAGAVWRAGGAAGRRRVAVAVARTVHPPRRRRAAGAADEGHGAGSGRRQRRTRAARWRWRPTPRTAPKT